MRNSAVAAALAVVVGSVLPAPPANAQLPLTPAQTEGPYYPARQRPAETDNDLTRVGDGPQARGDVLNLRGTVVDTTGAPVAGARIEIWQTDHQGIYMHPGDRNTSRRDRAFQFYGEALSDAAGGFSFKTIVPARYSGRARHIHVKITPPRSGTLTTQLYFAGDADLLGDGIARRLGPALASVTLSPTRDASSAEYEASVRFVVAARSRST